MDDLNGLKVLKNSLIVLSLLLLLKVFSFLVLLLLYIGLKKNIKV